ncbi:hypothetical protein G7046_g8349 [Stylonectria norvegica]|nr:hypothetical protein G7046_g8349 [Stylonectria norvegica]
MFAARRSLFIAPRASIARSCTIVPFSRFSSDAAAAPITTDAPTPLVDYTSTDAGVPTPSEAPAPTPVTRWKVKSTPTNSSPSDLLNQPSSRTASAVQKPPVKPWKPMSPKTSIPSTQRRQTSGSSKPAEETSTTPAPTKTDSWSKPASTVTPTSPALPGVQDYAFAAPSSLHETEPITDTKDIDWEKSHYGISTKPVTTEQFHILMRPLKMEDIEVKPDGVIYLPEIKYRRRLNEAFGPMGWGLIPRGEAVVGESIVTREYALIIDGRFVSQSQGENNYFGADQLPSAVEGCKSNALMRCSKDLGIASELWDPHFIRWFKKQHMTQVWVEHATTKKKRTLWFRVDDVEVAYPYKRVK